jgi:hypothetical protein
VPVERLLQDSPGAVTVTVKRIRNKLFEIFTQGLTTWHGCAVKLAWDAPAADDGEAAFM